MPDEPLAPGPYISPTNAIIDGTRRTIRAAGGDVGPNSAIHRSGQVRYQDDPEALQKQRRPGLSGGSTCGCGRGGVLALIPDARTGDEAAVCIFCDGVHLMPRYAPELKDL